MSQYGIHPQIGAGCVCLVVLNNLALFFARSNLQLYKTVMSRRSRRNSRILDNDLDIQSFLESLKLDDRTNKTQEGLVFPTKQHHNIFQGSQGLAHSHPQQEQQRDTATSRLDKECDELKQYIQALLEQVETYKQSLQTTKTDDRIHSSRSSLNLFE